MNHHMQRLNGDGYKLWLDDDRDPPEGWVWAQTGERAIDLLKHHQSLDTAKNLTEDDKRVYRITHMSFDHDLADVHYEWWAAHALAKGHPARVHAEYVCAKEMTGYDVLLWMAEYEVWPTEACYVHTHNSARGPVMADMINRYGPYQHKTRWQPYCPTPAEVQAVMFDRLKPNPEGA